jgi:hypothetical protein
MVALKNLEYGGWPNCLRLSDGKTEAVVTTDVGPRVIRFGFIGGPNVLREVPGELGLRGGKRWRLYGGHRLWIAPELRERTGIPDNEPAPWSWNGKILTLATPADGRFRIRKEMRLSYSDGGSLRVQHRLINEGRRSMELAPWAVTVMAPGGEAIVPQEPHVRHPKALLPVRPLVLWPYSNMSDPCWSWGAHAIRCRQSQLVHSPQKIGLLSRQGWMAYVSNGQAFIKRHPVRPEGHYPDLGCNVEIFVARDMLEMETLGPLKELEQGEHHDFEEVWMLRKVRGRPDAAGLGRLAKGRR